MVEPLLVCAGNILAAAKQREASLKSLIYDSQYRHKDRLTAVVMETQRYLPIIEELLEKSGASAHKPLADGLLQVVTYELLFGKGLRGRDAGGLRKAIRPYQRGMKDHLREIKEEKGASDSKDLLEKCGIRSKEEPVPRYIRVNLLKNSYEEVETALIDMGYTCIVKRSEVDGLISGKEPAEISSMMLEYMKSLKPLHFMADLHLPDVAVVSPCKSIYRTVLYKERKIIMMDKASCIPATVLAPPLESHVIDTCAAPGNKTNHLACLMQNSGKIFAFDMDQKRTETLKNVLDLSGVTSVETRCADFLEVDPEDEKYAQVSHVLVDPSCSGSGIVSRKDHLTGEGASRKRLKLLRGLQLRILTHAMRFPSVRKVVYSTCSIHRDENEEVVWRILKENPDFKLVKILPSWDHRPTPVTLDREETGKEDGYERDEEYFEFRELTERQMCKRCLTASFEVDKTNGFFVALFKKSRKSVSSANGHQVTEGVRQEKENVTVESSKQEDLPTRDDITRENRKKKKKGSRSLGNPQVKDMEENEPWAIVASDVHEDLLNDDELKTKKKKKGSRSVGNLPLMREGVDVEEETISRETPSSREGKSAKKRKKASLGKDVFGKKKKRLTAEL